MSPADPPNVVFILTDDQGPWALGCAGNDEIRTPEHKYVHRFPYGPHELYDLASDPDERKNLADDKSKRPVVAELRRRLADWFARYVDRRLDGARLPVCGEGQIERIDDEHCGEEAFFGPPQ